MNKQQPNHTSGETNEIPIVVTNLSKKYARSKIFAVEGLNFSVRAGQFHGFIGANGAGKTTTIKSIIGAYARFQGDVKIFGHKHSSIKAKQRIGYIPEVANFPRELSAIKYLQQMAMLSGLSRKTAKNFAKEKLIELDLQRFANRNPNRFSSGQKKKVLLAQALINNPDIIIMDEPAANLDPQARKDFFRTLKKLQKQGKAIFLSSHILVEIEQYIDTVTIIDHGKILYSGAISKIVKKDKTNYIFKFKDASSQSSFIKFAANQEVALTIVNDQQVVAEIKNQRQISELLKIIASKNLKIEFVKEDLKSLQDVYDDFISKGSLDSYKASNPNQEARLGA